jgi:PAS domain S-box-containing protein
MNWSCSYSHDVWPALITLVLVGYLGAYSWRRRHIPAAKLFTLACVLGMFWILGVILELLSDEFSAKIFWVKFQAVWQLPIAAVISCFILEFARLGRFLNRRVYALLFVIPMLSVLAIITNDFHHLVWTGFQMNQYVVQTHGRLTWFFTSYIFLLGLINMVVLIRLAIISPGHRLSVTIILLGQVIARVGYTIDKFYNNLLGPGESLLLVGGVAAVSYALAFLRFNAIDPVAAARAAVLDQMSDGLIVLDLQGCIVDVNPRTVEILGSFSARLENRPLAEVMPVDAGILQQIADTDTGQTDISLGEGDLIRQYILSWSRLQGRQSELIGKLLLLNDVTKQKQVQTEIIKQQRVVAALKEREHLAHELHDGIGQIVGYISMQAETALKLIHDGNREKVVAILGRIVEVTKDAHADLRHSILSLRSASNPKRSFIANLKQYVNSFSENYGIRAELSLSGQIDGKLFDPDSELELLRVIQEALTNSRKHSGAQSLTVTMELNRHRALITILKVG